MNQFFLGFNRKDLQLFCRVVSIEDDHIVADVINGGWRLKYFPRKKEMIPDHNLSVSRMEYFTHPLGKTFHRYEDAFESMSNIQDLSSMKLWMLRSKSYFKSRWVAFGSAISESKKAFRKEYTRSIIFGEKKNIKEDDFFDDDIPF